MGLRVCVCLCVCGFVWKILWIRGLMGDGGVLFGRNGWADSAGVYTVSRRSLEERGEVIQDHCARHVSMYWCVGADWDRGLKSMGFWMSVANVGGIFGVKEDEQVGMSWKLGWNFCSNETTGYQARKEMACITVGDWRLRLIQLRNRFERIIFFRIWIRVSQLFPPQDGVSAAKLLKEAWVAGGTPNCPQCGVTQLTTLSVKLRTTWEDKSVLHFREVIQF